MDRLIPSPGPVDVEALIADLRLAERAADDRPYVIANFVSSVDGRAAVDGTSGGLGSPGDKVIFRTLRAVSDAVLAGTGTLAAEHYGRLVRQDQAVALRQRLGLAPQPTAVTVTRSGRLPDGIPLLDDPGSRLIVYAGRDLDLSGVSAQVTVERRAPDALTMAAVLADLRHRHGVRLLLCEGGPTVFGELVIADLADELFLTLAAAVVGGDGGAITTGPAVMPPEGLHLRWVLEEDGALYLRYGFAH